MSEKSIKIDNSGGGVINIFYDGAPPIAPIEASPAKAKAEIDENSTTIRMAAMDKYSSPMEAFVDISPWGENMHKVSLMVRNTLIGQVIQQNYLFYNEKSKAKETYNEIIKLMGQYKDKAEKGLVHSAILSQQMRNDMSKFKGDLTPAESNDVYNRFQNDETIKTLESGIPPGLLTYDPNHFPFHNGIVKQASKEIDFIKIAENIENGIVKNFDRINIRSLCQFTLPEVDDSDKVKVLKRNALTSIRPILSNFIKKSDEWIKAWITSNPRKVEACVNDLYAIAFEKISGVTPPEKIDPERYEFFIFDADRTLWDSTVPAAETMPPYEFARTEHKDLDGDCVVDAAGNKVALKPGIRQVLEKLKTMDKVLGLISKSEKQGVPYEDQPVLHLLKKFGILSLFDRPIAICQDLPKSIFIPQDVNQKHIVFIDDDPKNLLDVDQHTDADVVDIKEMEREALKKKKHKKHKGTSWGYPFFADFGDGSCGEVSECGDGGGVTASSNRWYKVARDYRDKHELTTYDGKGWWELSHKKQQEIEKEKQKIWHTFDMKEAWDSATGSHVDTTDVGKTMWQRSESFNNFFNEMSKNPFESCNFFFNSGCAKAESKNWYKIAQISNSIPFGWLIKPDVSGNIWNVGFHPSRLDENNPDNVRLLLRMYSESNSPEDWVKEDDKNIMGAWFNHYRPEGWDADPAMLQNTQQELLERFAEINNIQIKTADKSMDIDGREYVPLPKGYGPSGSQGAAFEMKKRDGILWIPKSRLLDWEKEIFDDFEHEHFGASGNSWYKEAKKREYIPADERPEKPKDGKEYELDHKKPRWKGGTDKKENLKWTEKNKHKNKSSNEGSFEHGGDDRQKKLKGKGKKDYSNYQSDTAKEKIKQEKDKLGDKGFSELQRERVNKRWHKSDLESWYKMAQETPAAGVSTVEPATAPPAPTGAPEVPVDNEEGFISKYKNKLYDLIVDLANGQQPSIVQFLAEPNDSTAGVLAQELAGMIGSGSEAASGFMPGWVSKGIGYGVSKTTVPIIKKFLLSSLIPGLIPDWLSSRSKLLGQNDLPEGVSNKFSNDPVIIGRIMRILSYLTSYPDLLGTEQQLLQQVATEKTWYRIAQLGYMNQPDFFNTPEEMERMDKASALVSAIKNALNNLGDPDSPLLSDEPDDPTDSPGWEDRVRESYDSSGYGSDEENDPSNQWNFITYEKEEDVGNFFRDFIAQIDTMLEGDIGAIREQIELYRQNPTPDGISPEGENHTQVLERFETTEIPYLEGVRNNINTLAQGYDNISFYTGSGSKYARKELLSLFTSINEILKELYLVYRSPHQYINFGQQVEMGGSEYFPKDLKQLIEAIDGWDDYIDYVYESNKDNFEESEIENEYEYHREKIRDFLRDLEIPERVQELYGNVDKIEELIIGFLNEFNFSDLEDLKENINNNNIELSRHADGPDFKEIFNNINKLKTYSLFDEETFRDVILNPEIGGYDVYLRNTKSSDPELDLVLKFIKDNKNFQTMEVELPPLPDIDTQENIDQPQMQAYRGDSLAGAPVIKKQLDKVIYRMKSKNDFSDPNSVIPTLAGTGAEIDTRVKSAWIGSNLPKFIEQYKLQQENNNIRSIDIIEPKPPVDLEKVMGGPKALRQWANHRVFVKGETLHDALYYLFDKKAQDQPPGLAKFLNLVANSSKEDIVKYINNRKVALEQGYPDTPKGINQYTTDRILAMVNDPNAQGGFIPMLVQHGYGDDDIKEFLENVKIAPEAKIPSGVWTIGDYTFRILEKADPTGAILGNVISCCQKIGGVGEECVYDGYENPKSGFMTVYDKSGKTIAMSYIKLGNSNSLYLDNIEAVDRVAHNSNLRQAYLDWARRIKEEREYVAVYAGCGYSDMRFNTQKHTININNEFSSNSEAEDSTDVYTDLKSGAFRIAKKSLVEYYVMAGEDNEEYSDIIEKLNYDSFSDEAELIQYLTERKIPYNKIKFENDKEIFEIKYNNTIYVIEDLDFIEEVHDWIRDLGEFDLYALYPNYKKDPLEDVGGILYHGTSSENVESILREGLNPMDETRGISNRNFGAGIFATPNEDSAGVYGDAVIQIDVRGMIEDGLDPSVSFEDGVEDRDLRSAVAHRLGIHDYHEDDSTSEGIFDDTVIFLDPIPPKYLKLIQ